MNPYESRHHLVVQNKSRQKGRILRTIEYTITNLFWHNITLSHSSSKRTGNFYVWSFLLFTSIQNMNFSAAQVVCLDLRQPNLYSKNQFTIRTSKDAGKRNQERKKCERKAYESGKQNGNECRRRNWKRKKSLIVMYHFMLLILLFFHLKLIKQLRNHFYLLKCVRVCAETGREMIDD